MFFRVLLLALSDARSRCRFQNLWFVCSVLTSVSFIFCRACPPPVAVAVSVGCGFVLYLKLSTAVFCHGCRMLKRGVKCCLDVLVYLSAASFHETLTLDRYRYTNRCDRSVPEVLFWAALFFFAVLHSWLFFSGSCRPFARVRFVVGRQTPVCVLPFSFCRC